RNTPRSLAYPGGCARDGLLASARAFALSRPGRLHSPQDASARLRGGQDSPAPAAGALDSKWPLGEVRRAYVRCRRWRTSNGAQADVLSLSCPDIQQAPSLLAGPAAPLCRVRQLSPRRTVWI